VSAVGYDSAVNVGDDKIIRLFFCQALSAFCPSESFQPVSFIFFCSSISDLINLAVSWVVLRYSLTLLYNCLLARSIPSR
jgi:hypothetical protein